MTKTEHLKTNRTLILSRSLLAAAAGMLPVPYIDDLLAGAVRSALVRRLAEIRKIDLDANAVDALAHPYGSRVLQAATVGAIALGGTRRIVRKIAMSLLLVRRVDEAVQTFQLGTLFDHYAATAHVGPGLDGKRGLELRQSMELAVRKARSESLVRAFKRGLRVMGRAAASMPRGAFSLFSKLGRSPFPAEKIESLDERIDAAASSPFVGGAVGDVEAEVSTLERTYISTLIDAFDQAWRAGASERAG